MNTPVDVVRTAAARVIQDMRDDLARFALVLFPTELSKSFGGWLLPAESQASATVRKSYELHKLIEQIEDKLRDAAKTTVTIDLRNSSTKNG